LSVRTILETESNSAARKMRIAFFLNSFPEISETFVLNQITGLLDRGHDVVIYAKHRGADAPIHPCITRYELLRRTRYLLRPPSSALARRIAALAHLIQQLPLNPAKVARAFPACLRGGRPCKILCTGLSLLPERPCDAVLAHFGTSGARAIRLRRVGALSGRIATVFHGFDMTKKLTKAGRRAYDDLFQEGELFLPISQRWSRSLAHLGCPADRTVVHRMGIDRGMFPFAPREDNPNQPVNIVSVARLVEKKGIEYGLRAVAETSRRHPRVRYTVVGDGPLRPELERLASRLGTLDRVRFLGMRSLDEVADVLRTASIFLAPSVTGADGDQEGIPVALMEAMSSGLPVISTQHSGIPELVEHGISGFLAPEADAAALARHLTHLIEHPELWPAMGEAGSRKIQAEYDIETLNDRLVGLLERLCAVSPAPNPPART